MWGRQKKEEREGGKKKKFREAFISGALYSFM
jgi:hypothetical protein